MKQISAVRFIAMLALWLALPAMNAAQLEPHYFEAKPGSLAKAKKQIATGDKDLTAALKKLVSDADAILKDAPPSVTQKTAVPPSGDRHDYMSLAPYFWPDPASTNGLPYIRHDGKVNPECRDEKANDSVRIRVMGRDIETLALAYYFTTNEAYAAKATQFANVWFLSPDTRMNPNLKYAQAVLGVNSGRGTGILEGRHIAVAADAMGLLSGSVSWTPAEQKALNDWLNQYLDWLLTSDAGKAERNARNNHGTWFDVQAVRLALCVGRTNVARTIVNDAKQRRIAVQIQPDGRQPLELERTTSFNYSCFNLDALSELATLGEYVEVDLWHFETADQRGILRGIEFMLPYVDKPAREWPFEQIKDPQVADFLTILRRAAPAYNHPEFSGIIAKYPDGPNRRSQLLFLE